MECDIPTVQTVMYTVSEGNKKQNHFFWFFL